MKSSCLQCEVKVQGRCPRKDLRLKEKKDSKEYADFLRHSRKLEILQYLTLVALCVCVCECVCECPRKYLIWQKTHSCKLWNGGASDCHGHLFMTSEPSARLFPVNCELNLLCFVGHNLVVWLDTAKNHLGFQRYNVRICYWRSAAYASFTTQQFLCAFLYFNFFIYCEWDISLDRGSNGMASSNIANVW